MNKNQIKNSSTAAVAMTMAMATLLKIQNQFLCAKAVKFAFM